MSMLSAQEWNDKYKSGQPVYEVDDLGDVRETKTRSPAWDLCGSVVVSVEGRTGGYMLERLTPR